MTLFEFLLTFDGGRSVKLYFHALDRETAWDQVWHKAIEQGHDPHKIRGLELNWYGKPGEE